MIHEYYDNICKKVLRAYEMNDLFVNYLAFHIR